MRDEILDHAEQFNWLMHEKMTQLEDVYYGKGLLIWVSKQGRAEPLVEFVSKNTYKTISSALQDQAFWGKYTVTRHKGDLLLLKYLSPCQYQVFSYLRTIMLNFNLLPHNLPIKDMAQLLKRNAQYIRNSVAELKRLNVIYDSTSGGRPCVRMNGAFGWRGPIGFGKKDPRVAFNEDGSIKQFITTKKGWKEHIGETSEGS